MRCWALLLLWCALAMCDASTRPCYASEEETPVVDLERAASPDQFQGRMVRAVEVQLNGPYRLRDLTPVVVVDVGKPLSLRDVSRSIELLYRLGAIDDVLAEATPRGDGVRVRFRVWPSILVRRVSFSGNQQVGSQTLREQLTLRPGSVYTFAEAKAQASNLSRFYQNEGFYKVKIVPTSRKVRRSQMDVTFQVDEGPQLRIKELRFEDNVEFNPRLLQQVSGLEEGARFRPTSLEDSRKALQEYLRGEKHLGAKVKASFDTDSSREWVTVRFEVDEGPRIELEFFRIRPPVTGPYGGYIWHKFYNLFPWAKKEGIPRKVDFIRRRQLLKALDLDVEQQFTVGFSAEAAERLQALMYQEGFNGPKVRSEHVSSPDGRTDTFRFVIDSGQKVYIQNVTFEGNAFFDARTLREVFNEAMERFAPPKIYTDEALEQALPLVGDYYRSEGFLDIRLTRKVEQLNTSFGPRAIIRIRLEEGPRTLVREVELIGNAVISGKELLPLIAIAADEPYDENKVRQSLERIRQLYASRGYMNAQVFRTWELRKDTPTAVSVRFEIDEGTQAQFGEVIVRGIRRTRPNVILRELVIKPGEVYSPDKIEESKRRLNDTGLFEKASIYPLEDERVRDMMVEVRERKPKTVSLSGGVLLNGFEASLDAARFDASLEVAQHNLWGLGHRVTGRVELATSYLPEIEAKSPGEPLFPDYTQRVAEDLLSYLDRATSRRVVLSYQSPYLLGLRLKSIATATLFEREVLPRYLLNRSSLGWTESKDVTRRFNLSVQGRVAVRKPDDDETDAKVQLWDIDREQRLFLQGGTVLLYDHRDSRFDPTKGYLLSLQGEVGQAFGCDASWDGLTGDCSTGLPQTREAYLRLSASGSMLVPLLPWLRGEARTQGGYYIPLNTENGAVPMEKRFYLGGAGTVRGYLQDSLGPVRFRDKDIPSSLVRAGTVVPTGGNASVSYTLELQFSLRPLIKSLESWEVAVFHDAGNVFWTGASQEWFNQQLKGDTFPSELPPGCQDLNGESGLRYSVGVGLRYRSGIGPIRFDLGFPLARKCAPVERAVVTHLSIGLF